MPTFKSDTARRARKEHKCDLCGEKIIIGSTYLTRAGNNCGDFWFLKMHPECFEETSKWSQDDWESFEPQTLKRPETVDVVRFELGDTLEFIEVGLSNRGVVSLNSNLKSLGVKISDIAWNAMIDGAEAAIVSFVVPGGMDIHSDKFRLTIENTVTALQNYA